MRLIDADALFSALNDAKWYDNADREIALDYVEDAPTVEAVPVRHGYWVIADADKGEYLCSVCGETDTDCSDRYANHNVFGQSYCPNCGAKMDGDEV
jgi:hypothetical protein